MLLTIIVFAVIIILLVFVHEIGHFLAAKLTGVRVEEFAFGFPPRLISIKRGETRYSFNALPLGGYVNLYGEEKKVPDTNSYSAKPIKIRILIIVAGALMNLILAIILLTIGFSIGMTPLVSDPATLTGQKSSQVMVAFVQPGSPADANGIKEGTILNGFSSASDLQNFTHSHVGQEVNLSLNNQGQVTDKQIKLNNDTNAPLGVAVVSITTVRQNVFLAFWTAVKETGKVIGALFVFLWTIIHSFFTTGHAGPAAEGVSGPVGIYNFTAQALKLGWIYVLQLVILLSINLGVINLLPFPALDGGKALFLGLEGIFRKKVVRQEVENIIHLIGFVILIILILAVTYRDIIHLR